MDPIFENLIYSRFCACYLPQFIGLFVKNQERGGEDTIHSKFEACTLLLGHLYENGYFAKFMLSQHSNALDGNDLAMLISRWLILDADALAGGLQMQTSAKPVQAILDELCNLLYVFMCLLLYKEGACAMCGPRILQLLPHLRRWSAAYQRLRGASNLRLKRIISLALGENEALERALDKREQLEGLRVCAMPGCDTPGTWQCAKCKTVVYCGRKHQREHWHGSRVPHKSVCYATNF